MNFETLEKHEVFFASTNQYQVKFDDGTVMQFRVAEDSNGTKFYVLTDSDWTDPVDGNKFHDAFINAFFEGSLQ